jgi:pimeloyl-ACP methyl ester carboxylesterase
MPDRYCIWAYLLLLPIQAAAQTQPAVSSSHAYTIFVGGTVAGREDVTVSTTDQGVAISGTGRLSGSLDIIMRRAEVRYRADWTPEMFELEAFVNGGDTMLQTTFTATTALTKGVDGGRQIDQTSPIPGPVLVLPNVFFGSYEALTRRLSSASSGQQFAAFLGAGTLGQLQLTGATTERMQIGTASFTVRRYALTFGGPQGAMAINVFADENGSLLRVNIPARSIDVMRDDLASSTARTVVYSNPGDEPVTVRAAGFNLGATITSPKQPAARMPAVILLGGAGSDDRDGVVGGVPILGQLAGALADAGFLAVRFDKRGFGQSGGRAESATLSDHADDALAIVKWLSDRRDVDRNRIALVGHNEGAWTAFVAADRERRIAAVVSLSAPASTGSERVLEQQRHALDQLSVSPSEKVAKIELQKKINTAVLSGRGWEEIPEDLRKQADTPWFQSFLAFDPAKAIDDVRQPLLFIHGELDAEVPVEHVDRLADLARKQSNSKSISVVTVRGVNHLLVPAVTGEIAEYPTLTSRSVSPDVTAAVTKWLTMTIQSVR